ALGAAAMKPWAAQGAGATCARADGELAGAWDGAVRGRVAAAFAREPSIDPAERARAEAALDAYGAAWVAEREDACGDTRVRASQSEALMDRRMECLDRLRGELGAL